MYYLDRARILVFSYARSFVVIFAWAVAMIVSHIVIFQLADRLIVNDAVQQSGRTPLELQLPDALFGYTPAELQTLYRWYGPKARQGYIWVEIFDFLAIMPSYTGLLSTSAAWLWTKLGYGENGLVLAPSLILVAADVIENSFQIYTAVSFQEIPKASWNICVMLGSIFNRLKWVMLGACSLQLIILGIGVLLFSAKKKIS